MTTNTEAEVAEARHGVIHATIRATDEDDVLHIECRFDDGQKYAAVEVSGHRAEGLAETIIAALRTASQGECAAHPGECSMGSHGPGGAIQCKHCGNEATPASASDAIYQVKCDGTWDDVSSEYFYGHDGSKKRILYTNPAPASAEPAYDRESEVECSITRRLSEIEDKVAANQVGAAWVFTQMGQLLGQWQSKAIQERSAHEVTGWRLDTLTAKRDASGEGQQGNMELRATLVQIERENREGWKQAAHWRQLAEQQRARVPEGYVLVPRLMTLDMEVAFCEVWFSQLRCIDDAQMQDAWVAALALATPPQEGAGNG